MEVKPHAIEQVDPVDDDTTIDKTVTKTNEIEKSIPHPTKGKFLDRMV